MSVEQQGAHEGGGRVPLGAPPTSWAPQSSTDVLLPPIYTYVPPNYQIRSQNLIHRRNLLYPRDPILGPVRSSAGGGIDHGGLLHQHHSPSDEV